MVELMATFGVMAKELFDYNRDIFKFDQEMRLERDILRLEMQVKRFELFREDIRDLVELTVGKMEMYHLVGALFMEFCIAFYVEGKIETAVVPTFALALYYLAVAGAFSYLMLAVWYSLMASISSHSFGVRLLTRYVRLPIPSAEQMKQMNAKLANFEKERAGMARVPFLQRAQQWQEQGGASLPVLPEDATQLGGARQPRTAPSPNHKAGDFLGRGELPFAGGEESIMKAATKGLAGAHVSLFRRLQAKWQCYDAYARVSMAMGINQLLLSVSFYLILVLLVEYRSPTAAYSLCFVFQSCALALAWLDISGVKRRYVFLVQCVSSVPVFLACIALTTAKTDPDTLALYAVQEYPLAPFCFFGMVFWLECMLRVAWPSQDEATLPRRFRMVLFLDVFGDTNHDPQDAEHDGALHTASSAESVSRTKTKKLTAEQITDADDACWMAHEAIRRWETLPAVPEFETQLQELKRLRRELHVWLKALHAEVKHRAAHKEIESASVLHEDKRTFYELTDEERLDDTFHGRLLGPFLDNRQAGVNCYYWDAEQDNGSFVWQAADGARVLSLKETSDLVADSAARVRDILSDTRLVSARREIASSDEETETDSDDEDEEVRRCCFRKWRSHMGPYVPQRLPWRILWMLTRSIQLAWLGQGTMSFLREYGIYTVDHVRLVSDNEPTVVVRGREQVSHSSNSQAEHLVAQGEEDAGSEHRRLFSSAAGSTDPPLRFELSAAIVPSSGFGEARLSCLPTVGDAAPGNTLITAELGVFQVAKRSDGLSEGFAWPGYDVATTLACAPRLKRWQTWPAADADVEMLEASGCLAVTPRGHGDVIEVAQPQQQRAAVELKVDGDRHWRHVTGSQVECDFVNDMLVDPLDKETVQDSSEDENWCLLLVGSDGSDVGLPVAALRLTAGIGSLPRESEVVVPVFRLPLPAGSGRLVDLQMQAATANRRVWALFDDSQIAAWQVLQPQFMGRWLAAWPSPLAPLGHVKDESSKDVEWMGFRAVGLCEVSSAGQLLVLGEDGALVSGADSRLLLTAEISSLQLNGEMN
eukprot:TRINITY_DN3709_c0_g1_i1.p1 TRINITY_DN3709_c0_g1~~TRINITY_DN3709_c0_g1_i1.p1  ORF type:complete len:1047 (-),score=175.60 TRINITY_DN3709_c0_g1_i1:150-3290(-)